MRAARMLAVPVVLLLACGEQAPTQPDLAPPAAADYCEATADFFCDFYLRCGRIVADTKEACRASFLETCNVVYEPRYVDLVRAGLLTLSADGIEACRAHLATVGCGAQSLDLDGPCGAMWRGTQPVGGGCGTDVESFVCGPGSVCILDLSFCGTCEAAAPTGGSCAAGERCGATDYCDGAACRARPRPGEACSSEAPCAPAVRCTDGRCVGIAYVGVGEACDSAHRCAYGASCEGGTCVLDTEPPQACSDCAPLPTACITG